MIQELQLSFVFEQSTVKVGGWAPRSTVEVLNIGDGPRIVPCLVDRSCTREQQAVSDGASLGQIPVSSRSHSSRSTTHRARFIRAPASRAYESFRVPMVKAGSNSIMAGDSSATLAPMINLKKAVRPLFTIRPVSAVSERSP